MFICNPQCSSKVGTPEFCFPELHEPRLWHLFYIICDVLFSPSQLLRIGRGIFKLYRRLSDSRNVPLALSFANSPGALQGTSVGGSCFDNQLLSSPRCPGGFSRRPTSPLLERHRLWFLYATKGRPGAVSKNAPKECPQMSRAINLRMSVFRGCQKRDTIWVTQIGTPGGDNDNDSLLGHVNDNGDVTNTTSHKKIRLCCYFGCWGMSRASEI